MHVNTYWMCDTGRLAVPDMVNENRLQSPQVRRGGQLVDVSWNEAIDAAASALKGLKGNEIFVFGSAKASNEDNYLMAKLAHDVLKTGNVDFIKHNDHAFGDDILRLNDRAPNAIGAHSVGIAPKGDGHSVEAFAGRASHGTIKTVIVLGDDPAGVSQELAQALAGVENIIVIGSHNTATTKLATIILPRSVWAEYDGTFTNTTHRVQRFQAAVVTKENQRTMGMRMSRWDKFGAPNDRWTNGERRDCRPAWRIISQIAEALGTTWNYVSSASVFADIATHIAPFKGMSAQGLDEHQGLVLGKGTEPEPKGVVYESHVLKPQ
jgi:predicted molibdopterin-dependent oxidoreductase YjgC